MRETSVLIFTSLLSKLGSTTRTECYSLSYRTSNRNKMTLTEMALAGCLQKQLGYATAFGTRDNTSVVPFPRVIETERTLVSLGLRSVSSIMYAYICVCVVRVTFILYKSVLNGT